MRDFFVISFDIEAITNRIYGMLVVRESVRKEVHSDLIDHDESNHTITLRGVQSDKQPLILVNDASPAQVSHKASIYTQQFIDKISKSLISTRRGRHTYV